MARSEPRANVPTAGPRAAACMTQQTATPPPSPRVQRPQLRRLTLLLPAALYLLFVVYGSLVPLHYRPLPLTEAVARFRHIPFLDLGVGSRADWVANLLLFVPLAFLWTGVLWPRSGYRPPGVTNALRALVVLLMLGLLLALSVAIEFTQIYFPPRTVSQNDILAEALGALVGTALWCWRGPAVSAWLHEWQAVRTPANLYERWLWLYLACCFAYNLLPLDLTLSPVELHDKWREGRIVLVPFASRPASTALFAYNVATDALLWVPVAVLAVLSGRRTAAGAIAWTVGLAGLLEFLQLFVFTRVTDVTDVLTAALGAGFGVWLTRGRAMASPSGGTRPEVARLLPALACAALWGLALLWVFWFPFDFRGDGGWLKPRLALLWRVPFQAYYFGTEYRAATSLMQKVLFFAPLGVAFAFAAAAARSRLTRALVQAAAVLALIGLPALIEAGQIALPGKNPDPTDWMLAVLGGSLGYYATRRWLALHGSASPAPALHTQTQAPAAAPPVPAAQMLTKPAAAAPPAPAPQTHTQPAAAAPAAVAPLHLRPGSTTAAESTALAWTALGLVTVLTLLPLAARPGWQWTPMDQYLPALPVRLYECYKSTLLWILPGALLVTAGLGRYLFPAAIVLVSAVALAGVLGGASAGYRDLLELAGIVIGLAAGGAVARRVPALASGCGDPATAARWGSPSTVHRGGAASAALPAARPAAAVDVPPALRARSPVQRLALGAAALLLLATTLWLASDMPRFAPELCFGLLAYAALLAVAPGAWLVVLPAALPVLDLAPWTGRLFLDEFDLLLLTSVAMALGHGLRWRSRARLSRPLAGALVLFTLCWTIGTVVGLLPLQPLDANAFASYWSHYNSLRVSRGFIWALVLLWLLHVALPQGTERGRLDLTLGLLLGLAGVCAMGVLERWQYGSLFDPTVSYRITSTFSSIHTGGGPIEAALVATIPFLWYWLARPGFNARTLGALFLLPPALYVTLATVSRAGVAALALMLLLLLVTSALPLRARGRQRSWVMVASALLGLGLLAAGMQGAYFQSRLATVRTDLGTRLQHWSETVRMVDDGFAAPLFGMGLGRFPERYLMTHLGASLPATYSFAQGPDGNTFLRLGAGETVYMGQRVDVAPGTRYELSLRARSTGRDARLEAPLCEKHMLHSRACRWGGFSVPADGAWHTLMRTIDSGDLGGGALRLRPPAELFFQNGMPGTEIDIDDVHLRGPAGRDLVYNGGFEQGTDRWFIKANSHLPFHIKSLPVELYFSLGLAGLASFTLLLGTAGASLLAAARAGSRFALVALTASTGLLAVGGFDSLIDAPRIGALLFGLLLLTPVLAADDIAAANADYGRRG